MLIVLVFVGGRAGLELVAARAWGDPSLRVSLEVPSGANAEELARLLADEDLVASELFMRLYLRSSGTSELATGPHLFVGGESPRQIEARLRRATSRPKVKLTIPEGFHRYAIAERLEKLGITGRATFLSVSADPMLLEALEIPQSAVGGAESAEGYLFPATYELSVDSPAEEVLARLVGEARLRWQRLASKHPEGLAELERSLGWGRREIVLLASIVEKEAVVEEERPIIASVFLNRLRDPSFTPKRLQSDPTSAYGCFVMPERIPACQGFTGKITPALNQDPANRYSTYVVEGLPVGPISNPGERSIEAVLAPATSTFLYFVAKGGGRHHFSATLEEHNRAIRGER
jgi:UPF0755 protein